MTPQDPGFEARVRASFAAQKVMATLGVEIADIAPGQVILEMPFRDDLVQQHGFLHAGVVTTALDSACGYAAFSLMPATAEVLTVEFKSNFLRPATGETFYFEGRVVRPGRSLIITEGSAFALKGGERKEISRMSATMMVVEGREGINA